MSPDTGPGAYVWVPEPRGWIWVPDGWAPRYPGGPGRGSWHREGAQWVWIPAAGGPKPTWTWQRTSLLAVVALLWMGGVTIGAYGAFFRAATSAPAASVTVPLAQDGAGSTGTVPIATPTPVPAAPAFSLARADVTLNFAGATGGCPGFGNGPLPAAVWATSGVLSISLPSRPGVPAKTNSGVIDARGNFQVSAADPPESFEGQIQQGTLAARYQITIGGCTESYQVTAQLP